MIFGLGGSDAGGTAADTQIQLDPDDAVTPIGVRIADLHVDDFLL